MRKNGKIIVTVVLIILFLAAFYWIGSFYIKKQSKAKADQILQSIKASSNNITQIDYQSLSIDFFTLFTHRFEIHNIKIKSKQMPQNPIMIQKITVNNYKLNDKERLKRVKLNFENMHIDKAGKLIPDHYQANNAQRQSQNPAINKQLTIIKQFLRSKAHGHIQYSADKRKFHIAFNVNNATSSKPILKTDTHLKSFFENLSNHTSKKREDWLKALSQSQLKSLDLKLNMPVLLTPQLIKKTMPGIYQVIGDYQPALKAHLQYGNKNKQLQLAFQMLNQGKKNLVFKTHLNQLSLNELQLKEFYTKPEALNTKIGQAYLGETTRLIDVQVNLPEHLLAMFLPQVSRLLKPLPYQNYSLHLKEEADYSLHKHNYQADMLVKLKKIADLSVNYDLNVPKKITLNTIQNTFSSTNEVIDQWSANNNRSVVFENIFEAIDIPDFYKNVYLDHFNIKLTNHNLITSIIQVLLQTNQQDKIQNYQNNLIKQLQNRQNKIASSNVYQKGSLKGLIRFLQKPETIKLAIKPLKQVSLFDISMFFNERRQTSLEKQQAYIEAKNAYDQKVSQLERHKKQQSGMKMQTKLSELKAQYQKERQTIDQKFTNKQTKAFRHFAKRFEIQLKVNDQMTFQKPSKSAN